MTKEELHEAGIDGAESGEHLRDAIAVLIHALGPLPIDTEGASPACGKRAAVFNAAHQPRYNDIALRGGLLLCARARSVVGSAAVHCIAGGARVLQRDGAGGPVGISLHPGVCVIDSEEAVHLGMHLTAVKEAATRRLPQETIYMSNPSSHNAKVALS